MNKLVVFPPCKIGNDLRGAGLFSQYYQHIISTNHFINIACRVYQFFVKPLIIVYFLKSHCNHCIVIPLFLSISPVNIMSTDIRMWPSQCMCYVLWLQVALYLAR